MPHTDICIIGAGLSGLALATFLRAGRPELELTVLEAASRPGGAILTFHEAGWTAEYGPHGFLDHSPEGRELVALAGLEEERLLAPLSRFVRYLALSGGLTQVPQTPRKILLAPLMSWRDKFALAMRDLTTPYLEGSPSVAEWVDRRFGPVLLPFADAVFTGTWAGDLNELRIDGVMPALRALEQEHGSVIRALFAKLRDQARMRKARQAADGNAKPRGLPAMQSFKNGMEALPQALARPLAEAGLLHLDSPVTGFAPETEDKGWTVTTPKAVLCCRQLILALPVNAALALVRAALPDHAPPVTALPEARLASVVLGFGPEAHIPFGFGYLAPKGEGRFALGALFSGHMFPGRAPAEDEQLVEALVGGTRHPEHLDMADEELIAHTLADLRGLMSLPHAPRFAKVLRSPAGIPQANADYLALLPWRDRLHEAHPNLRLLGFGWNGIGMNDMIREAKKLAERLDHPDAGPGDAPLKGVYM